MTEVNVVELALLVAKAIESVGGTYFVGGSVASSLQGEPRSTNDLDVVLELPLGRIDAFAEALGPSFQVDRAMLRDALLHGRSCNVFYMPVLMKVDLFAVGPAPYDEVEFSRKERIKVPGSNETLVLKRPDDTVLRKLLWFREGGGASSKQWRDVVDVLRVSGDKMDLTYLAAWATRLGLTELLAKARAEV